MTFVAKCFCGCGEKVRGGGRRGANKMGHKTNDHNARLRRAHELLASLAAGGDAANDRQRLIARLESLLAIGDHYESFWAHLAHGNFMPSTAAFLEERREWYEWTKQVTVATRVALSEAARAENAGLSGDGPPSRIAALVAAGDQIDGELSQAPVDDFYIAILLSCRRGAYDVLELFCDGIEDPSTEVDNAPVLAFVASLADPEASERALRNVTWTMAARILTLTWPERRETILGIARAALPLSDEEYEDVWRLAAVTAEELQPIADDDPREDEDVKAGRWFTFCCDSLRLAIEAATGVRPTEVEVLALWTAPLWGECVAQGMDTLRAHLDEIDPVNGDTSL